MSKRPVFWIAAIVLNVTLPLGHGECRAGNIIVRFDQDVYTVSGPGESFVARILIDGDGVRDGIQSLANDLYSAGVKTTFDKEKATVGDPSDVVVPADMDFFGFGSPSLVSVLPPGEVAVHANIDQFNSPLVAYADSLLATVTFTNLATAIDSYPLALDFSRDLGINEDFFVDATGATIDSMITFEPSRVQVVPEPQVLPLLSLAFLLLLPLSSLRRRHN